MNSAMAPFMPASLPAPRKGEPAWQIALLFPNQGDWSEAEYLALPGNRLVEFSDGCLEVLPTPSVFHQLIVKYLLRLLDDFVTGHRLGVVLCAPLPVRLWAGRFREPDIVYLRAGRVPNVHDQPQGADLVMEIVCPGEENRDRDLNIKRQEYAAAGITEYWIVDPEQGRITVLALEGQRYREHGVFGAGDRATSALVAGLEMQVDQVFAAGKDGLHGETPRI